MRRDQLTTTWQRVRLRDGRLGWIRQHPQQPMWCQIDWRLLGLAPETFCLTVLAECTVLPEAPPR